MIIAHLCFLQKEHSQHTKDAMIQNLLLKAVQRLGSKASSVHIETRGIRTWVFLRQPPGAQNINKHIALKSP